MTKPKEKSPAMQFYFTKFSGDNWVMGMDLDTVGAHILLMCAAGESDEGYRVWLDDREIKNKLRNPSEEDYQRIKAQLLRGSWKISSDGRWLEQDGMRRTLLKQKEFSAKQRRNALGSQTGAKREPNGNISGAKRGSLSLSSSLNYISIKEPPEGKPEENSNPVSKHARQAESMLEEPREQPWTKENTYILMGRRPLRKYPEISLTAPELVGVLETYEKRNLPSKYIKECFINATQEAKKQTLAGKRREFQTPVVWLTTFILEAQLGVWTKEKRAQGQKTGYENPGKNRPPGKSELEILSKVFQAAGDKKI